MAVEEVVAVKEGTKERANDLFLLPFSNNLNRPLQYGIGHLGCMAIHDTRPIEADYSYQRVVRGEFFAQLVTNPR
jgi:hypothetical protein